MALDLLLRVLDAFRELLIAGIQLRYAGIGDLKAQSEFSENDIAEQKLELLCLQERCAAVSEDDVQSVVSLTLQYGVVERTVQARGLRLQCGDDLLKITRIK